VTSRSARLPFVPLLGRDLVAKQDLDDGRLPGIGRSEVNKTKSPFSWSNQTRRPAWPVGLRIGLGPCRAESTGQVIYAVNERPSPTGNRYTPFMSDYPEDLPSPRHSSTHVRLIRS